jgi:hypothetical protein
MPISTTVSSTPTSSAKANGVGELASLESSPYDFSTTRYPLSVGTDDAPHYVVFNINLPDSSKYIQTAGGTVANVQTASQTNYDIKTAQGGTIQSVTTSAGATATAQAAGGGLISGVLSGIQSNDIGTAAAQGIKGAIASSALYAAGAELQIKPKLVRVKKAIALYMPDTLLFEYQHDWHTSSVTDALGAAGAALALDGGISSMVGKTAEQLGKSIMMEQNGFEAKEIMRNNGLGAEAVGNVAQAFGAGSNFTELALRAVNKAINPQVEMVFQGTQNRGFIFTFDFQPRSSAEAADILDIVNTFRTYAAPELSNEGNGRYFIPPAQFDISFYFKNTPSAQIPKISTCALVGIAANYSGSGQFATFSDGMPVHINLQLTFKEMDIITRELIVAQGY